MVKSHKGWLVIGASMFALGLGGLVTSRPVSADVVATSTSSSAVNAETTGASSSSTVNAASTSANNSSAVNAEMTSASSAVNAETTGASSSSTVNAASTSANNSSAVNAEMTSASSSSATKAETTSASSSSATKADSSSASSSSAAKSDTASAASSSAVKSDTASAASSSAVKSDTASAASSSAVKSDTASAASSSAAKSDTASAASSSAAKSDTASTASSSAAKSDTASAVSSSAVLPSSGIVTVNKDNFDKYFNQNGSAINNYDKDTGIQTITNGSFQSGNVTFDGSIDVRNNFEIDGAINLGQVTSNRGYTGIADGIGFVFYKGDRNQVGGNGGNLGIYGVSDAFGWKVDTWLNDSKHTNSSQVLHGDYDDGHTNPYGAFITTNKDGYGTIDQQSAQNLVSSIEDNNFHNIKFIYTAATQEFKIVLSTENGDVTFSKIFDYDTTSPAYYFTIAASTGVLPTHQAFRIDSMTYSPIQKAIINYVDDTTGKTIASDSVTGDSEKPIDYSTASKISNFEKQGYKLVKDGFLEGTSYDDDDTVDQIFDVHLTHGTTPVGPNNPQTPGAPINPEEPNGPKWPISTNYDKTVNETVSYVDQNGHVVAKQHTDSVNFTRTVVVDNVTGEVITSGAGTTAWTATNGDTTFDAVVSPVVSGFVADKAQTAAVTDLNADSVDVNETVTYTKVGSLVPSSSDGNFPGAPTVVYPNDPSDATKVKPAGVPTVPGYTAHDPEGHVLTPGSSYQPSDPTKDTTITYTADKQEGSVSYVDDTTGKTLKTDSISGTTGSKSSYSTSGNIADYKKHGYELVTDGYPADLTFDNDDTTDQNFTVHLKHRLTPVNPTNPQTPGTPINPDEPDGPEWPTRTNYDKTVNETVSYVDQNGHVVAKQHTDSVNFTRTVVVDNVTGEVITSGAGTTAWTATNGDTTFDAVVSPVVPGSVADKAQTAAVTDLNADSVDVNETVTYTKVGSLVPSSSDGNFPGAPTVVYPNDPSDATKVKPAGVPTVPGYTAHDPEGHVLTPGSSYQPSDPTKDTTITYTADKQEGSVSYVDDTTGKTLKTDSISGTTGSKSSYSTSGNIADYKKHGYELVTDGYPADLTFDNDDTTDQNFTVHLKHRLTPVNPTNPQTPGTPINPDEPDGPEWPTRTNYDKTVNETVSYVDQNGHVVAKQHTDSVNFTRTVVVDNVTGEVITSGAGTTAWTATNGDTTFDAVVSPVVPGSVADKAQTAAVTDLNADSVDVNETVTYTKVGSLVPSSSDGNFPGAPTKPVNPSQPRTPAKPVQAGQATATNFVDQRLPQTGETDQQHMTLSGLLLLAMSSVLGLFGMTKRQRKE